MSTIPNNNELPKQDASENTSAEKTQKYRFEELLTEMGVNFESRPNDDFRWTEDAESTVTKIDNGIGYSNFCCEFTFDRNGKRVTYGCWED